MASHGLIGPERIVHTPAPVRCVVWLRRAARAASLVIALSSLTVPSTAASAMAPDGAWFIDGTGGAVQIFDCSGLLCGRIIWLWTARDIAGRPASDKRTRIRRSDSGCFAV